MQSTQSSRAGLAKRRPWEAPAVTQLPIGAETKSADTSGTREASPAQPQPPAAPTTKLGFSVEMAFPLSARLGQ